MEHTGTITNTLKADSGVDVKQCYQCGKCTAGCPMTVEMDYPPSLIVRMLQTDSASKYEEILRGKAIWLCVSCEQCIGRCPKEVDIPVLMDTLRARAIEKKCINKDVRDIVRFHKAFLDSIRWTGRLSEVGLIADYKLRSRHLWQDVMLAPSMWLKGKLHFIPELIKDRRSMRRLFNRKGT